MAIKRVSILTNYNLYESKRHFSQKLAEAMNRKGIETQLIDVDEGPLKLDAIRGIQSFNPTFTCSFNTLLPLSDEKYLWDFLQKPHISFLLDPLFYAMDLTRSPYSLLTVVDKNDVQEALLPNFDRIYFLGHAVERELLEEPLQQDRPYDVVFLGSCYDYESLRTSWQQRNPEGMNRVLEDAIDLIFSDNRCSLAKALATAWEHSKLDPHQADFVSLFYYLDMYTRGRDRVELIRAIKDVPVHVFGELSKDTPVGFLGWEPYLEANKNVTVHPSVSFEEGLEILKKAKICLNSMPFFRNGTHERIFTGLASGALPITSESEYLRESFIDGESLVYYRSPNWSAVAPVIQDLLKNEDKRRQMVEKGRKLVAAEHTWDAKVDRLEQIWSKREKAQEL